ncbi:DNA replication complex GINS protein PSF1 [Phlyctochytrium arcticum]|nr:DNA replication complex GINS protein PSF1 [Phlyctochytrium arcticum]
MSLYGDDALKLVRDCKRTANNPSLPPYRDDLVRNVILELRHLEKSLRELIAKRGEVLRDSEHRMSEDNMPGQPTVAGLTVAATMHNLSLRRSKRCLLAYLRHRIDRLTETLWSLGGGPSASSVASIPPDVRRNLSSAESDFMMAYAGIVGEYRGKFLEVDFGAAMIPPRDLFVEVRVVKECGEVMTENGAVRLVKDSQHYLRRTDVEHFITAGYLKHID